MRFFVDAGGDIDSNTRRTSIRKIQRRGGMIVFSPSEAQYIIVWDDTSDGQVYARTWSNEGKLVLTLEWVNRCVREEQFFGPSAGYGGCRVGITDGAIQPLAREGAFDEEEELATVAPPAGQPPKSLTSSIKAAAEVAPSSQTERRTTLPLSRAPEQSYTPHAPTIPHASFSSSTVTAQPFPAHNATPGVIPTHGLVRQPVPAYSTGQTAQDFKTVISQLHPETPNPLFNSSANVSSDPHLQSAAVGTSAASHASTSVAANLLSALPQHVLDMLTQSLQTTPSYVTNPQSNATVQQPSYHLETSPAQSAPSHPAAPTRSAGGLYGVAVPAIQVAALASFSTSTGAGFPAQVEAADPERSLPPSSTEARFPYDQRSVVADEPLQHTGLPPHGLPRTTAETALKREHEGVMPLDNPTKSAKRARLSHEAPHVPQPSPSFEQLPSESSVHSMPGSSQGSGTYRFFTIIEGGKEIQAGFWVQPELKERTKLIRAINRHGGKIAHSMLDCHYVVVRSSLSDTGKNKSAEMGWKHGRTVVKPAWIEACVAAHDLVPIDDYVMAPPVTPRKRGKTGTSTPTPKKVKADREDSTTTLADLPSTPSRSHVHDRVLATDLHSSLLHAWKGEPMLTGDSDDE